MLTRSQPSRTETAQRLSPLRALERPLVECGSPTSGAVRSGHAPVVCKILTLGLTRASRIWFSPVSGHKKTRLSGVFLEAAEGTRTLDLLHGKRYRIGREMAQKPWKSATAAAESPGAKFP
jgi:hypothetical protein